MITPTKERSFTVGLGTKTYGGIKIGSSFGAGAAADADITMTGIKTTDEILVALHFATSTAILTTDLQAEMTITEDGKVQNGTTDTTGGVVLVIWQQTS